MPTTRRITTRSLPGRRKPPPSLTAKASAKAGANKPAVALLAGLGAGAAALVRRRRGKSQDDPAATPRTPIVSDPPAATV